MAVLPFSRVVNVTVTRKDAFPARRGFGVPLFLSTVLKTGKVDATTRTKVYGSMEEVAADWAAGDDFYKAALAAFSQNPRPVQIKAAYLDNDPVLNSTTIKTALDAIYAYDNQWYFLCIDSALRDHAALPGLIQWIEAKDKQAFLDSNDADLENPADTTNIAAVHKGDYERTSIFYHTDATLFPAFALAGKLGTFNFDEAGAHYTAKFKKLAGISPLNKDSAVVQAVTGFTPQLGQSETAGHMANTYIDIGGQAFVVEGSTLKPNVFIDVIHMSDWIRARTEEEMLAILLNEQVVPFTDAGMEKLASAARIVMTQARRAGLVAEDLNPETGLYEPAVIITVPSAFDVPASQRAARIAPAILVTFRAAGAVHYATTAYTITF
jgi:hypothetical protein